MAVFNKHWKNISINFITPKLAKFHWNNEFNRMCQSVCVYAPNKLLQLNQNIIRSFSIFLLYTRSYSWSVCIWSKCVTCISKICMPIFTVANREKERNAGRQTNRQTMKQHIWICSINKIKIRVRSLDLIEHTMCG